MHLRKIGAVMAFVLTIQFLLTLWFIVLAWPKEGPGGWAALNGLADSIAAYIAGLAATPFMLASLYNAVFCVPAIVLAVALQEHLAEARHRMLLAVIGAAIAGGLWLAGGIIPVVTVPQIMAANDTSALRAVCGIAIGLILAATTAAGFAAVLVGSAGISTGRLPRLLCWLLIVGGVVEICEFAVPVFLIIDPTLGTIWSLWLGFLLLRSPD